jgi:hypothetical protein
MANEAENRNAKHLHQMPTTESWANILQGFLGERAVGKYFGYETTYQTYDQKQYDVLGYEVRTVKYDYAILITHKTDKKGIYICVSLNQKNLEATLKGWSSLYRCNARQTNWRSDWRSPCFGMPQEQLWPIDTLPATAELLHYQNRFAA